MDCGSTDTAAVTWPTVSVEYRLMGAFNTHDPDYVSYSQFSKYKKT